MSPHLIPLYVFSLDLNSHDYHKAAIDNLEAMLDPSLGVDAVLIGPHDLSCNLGNHQDDDDDGVGFSGHVVPWST